MKGRRVTASRYARALFDVARQSQATEGALEELARFRDVYAAQPELAGILGRPWLKPAERRAVATAVAERAGAGPLVQNFLGLVAARGRMDHLAEIVEAFRGLVDAAAGRARATVRTATPLTAAERERLGERLGRALGKQVALEETVDPMLLGGFVAQVGSLVLDGSLDGQLRRLHARLAGG
jgi:F-type H+-transporting ATPase subunit delta